jgi:hypothetical protein
MITIVSHNSCNILSEMFQNLNEKSNKESHYIAIKLQPRFNCAISRICEYYFIDRQEKTNTFLESHLLIYKINIQNKTHI